MKKNLWFGFIISAGLIISFAVTSIISFPALASDCMTNNDIATITFPPKAPDITNNPYSIKSIIPKSTEEKDDGPKPMCPECCIGGGSLPCAPGRAGRLVGSTCVPCQPGVFNGPAPVPSPDTTG